MEVGADLMQREIEFRGCLSLGSSAKDHSVRNALLIVGPVSPGAQNELKLSRADPVEQSLEPAAEMPWIITHRTGERRHAHATLKDALNQRSIGKFKVRGAVDQPLGPPACANTDFLLISHVHRQGHDDTPIFLSPCEFADLQTNGASLQCFQPKASSLFTEL